MREFLARNGIEHAFEDVRKRPIPAAEAVRLVRRHRRALSRKGGAVIEIDPSSASDAEIEKLFLGREKMLRAPTVSDGTTLLSGFDESALKKLAGLRR